MSKREQMVLGALDSMGAEYVEVFRLGRVFDGDESGSRVLAMIFWSFLGAAFSAGVVGELVDDHRVGGVVGMLAAFFLWSGLSALMRRLNGSRQRFPGELDVEALTPRQLSRALDRARRRAEGDARLRESLRARGELVMPPSRGDLSLVEGGRR